MQNKFTAQAGGGQARPAATDPYLVSIPQWLPVLLVWNASKNKNDKLPCDWRDGTPCNAHDPAFHTTHAHAVACAQAWGGAYTVGFVLTLDEDVFCLDIDHALQADGTWSPLANTLVAALPGCYVELSDSRAGVHVWGRYPSPPPHRKRRIDLDIELYTEARFIATGTPLAGAVAARCDAFPAFVEQWFKPIATNAATVPDNGPSPEWNGPRDDTELLRRAMPSRSAASRFGGKATFQDLWLADTEALARSYPADANSTEPYNRSSADAALAQHLAWWTGRDVARIERLMRQSKLARPKWDDRADYLVARTIMGACAQQTDVLQDRLPEPPPLAALLTDPASLVPPPPPDPAYGPPTAPAEPSGTMTAITGSTFLSPAEQVKHFNGCTYILDGHRVLVKGGDLLKRDQFKVLYGSRTFVMDGRNERTTRDAFEAFTENQVVRAPMAHGTCFKPTLAPGQIITTEGRARANVWWPPDVARVKGDPEPFLRHIRKLFPDEADQRLVLAYLVNMVQHVGHKFQFALVIIGVAGNGKTLLSRCVEAALGKRYVHWPAANKIGNQFNAWLFGRVAYLVEDAYLGGRMDLLETLKPMITGDAIEVESKGIDQRTDEVCGNFLFNANHTDALRKTIDDRRYMTAWCAQQAVGDLERDGMGARYFEELYGWANGGGYAIVAEYLHTVQLPPEHGLAWAKGRAPQTSSTARAIEATRSPAEDAVLSAIEDEEQGFCGGWISSIYLHNLLNRLPASVKVQRTQFAALLGPLGYVPHPALGQVGQVHNRLLDGTKPRLYVKKGHTAEAITGARDAAAAYSTAQGVAATFSAR